MTALLAWVVHAPLGQGAAYLAKLKHDAELQLTVNGLGKVQVTFPDHPLSRVAQLSGSANPVEQKDAAKLLASVSGAAGTVWRGDRGMRIVDAAVADTSVAAAPTISPKAPELTPTTKPAVVALSAVPEKIAAKPALVPAAAAAEPAGPTGPCQKAVDSAVGNRVMSFQPGSAWLNATSLAVIKDVATALKDCKGYQLAIAGHTDNVGDEGINRIMSEERAKRVRDALVARGIDGETLSAKGYGSSRPIRAGAAADPANRRITFTVSEAGADAAAR